MNAEVIIRNDCVTVVDTTSLSYSYYQSVHETTRQYSRISPIHALQHDVN